MEDATPESPDELHFYSITGNNAELEKRIVVAGVKMYQANLHYYKKLNCLVAFSFKAGLTIISLDGEILYHDKGMMINEFNPETGFLTKVEVNAITVYEIK